MIPKEMETFFTDVSEYMRFLLKLKELHKQATDKSCYASLKKEDERFLYSLAWKDGRWIGDYVKPFRANEENLRIFHAGCKEVTRRLQIYLDTNDPEKVPQSPPAFGPLSWESPEEPESNTPITEIQPPVRKYFPSVQEGRTVGQFTGGDYDILLLTDVKCSGIVRYSHLMVAFKKGEEQPSYVVAAEVNNLRTPGDGSGSHFLGYFSGNGHGNLGCSDEWGNLSHFDQKARKIMAKELNISIEQVQGA